MDSLPVNWEALDALLIDFAKSERLIEESSCPSSPTPSSSSYRWRILIRRIRHSLESGDIDSAIDLLSSHSPDVLEDQHLLFRLQKQKFIELLRKGTEEDRESAIKCVRASLAPCALNAYPEAYEEFKHVLLAFIYGEDDERSPVSKEWSKRRRFDIAGLLSSVLTSHLHAYDPVFSMTLRYLISIHKGFCLHQGISSPISDLTERLLLEERNPPAISQESSHEASPFNEVDIQALAHAVELTRQGAVDSLRFAKGDLHRAFQNELCRMRLDISLLDELVKEYCIYRGIVDFSSRSPGMQVSMGASIDDQAPRRSSDSDLSISHSCISGYSQSKPALLADHNEMRYFSDSTCLNEDCSTSTISQPDTKLVQRNGSSGMGEVCKRRRWRGRNESLEFGDHKHELSTNTCLNGTNTAYKKSTALDTLSVKMNKYEIVLNLKELASKGMTEEVVDEINSLDPEFFSMNPLFLFRLKQVEFLKLVQAGNHSDALKVAKSHLGPLAAKVPDLLKPLKETLLAFLGSNEGVTLDNLHLNTLATSLQVVVGRRFGIEEPQLMKIIRATLHTHSEWFKLQMCKDHFESLLWINSLKEVGSPMLGDPISKSNSNNASTQGSSQVTISSGSLEDGNSANQISSDNIGCDENAILKVMEFLALPRADAIHLLVQYDGNPEIVIQQMFA